MISDHESLYTIAMKKFYIFFLFGILSLNVIAQQDFNDFEGTKIASLAEWNGQVDSTHVTPMPNSVNSSSFCARYTRSTTAYDNFKFFPYGKLVNVTPYADNIASTPKMTMKVLTGAPVGTAINLQLGVRSNTTYPAGIHSEYTALTTVQNAWHIVTFNYVQSPPGSIANPNNIDKVVIFFKPNTTTTDTLYLDDFIGPALNIAGILSVEGAAVLHLSQNKPNPAQGSTYIDIQIEQPGSVSLKVYDILGKPVATLLDDHMTPGLYSVPFETSHLSNGVYFYELKKENSSKILKMTIAN
jgi:hypothetical protein